MKLVSIVGARPQFIKAAALSRQLRRWHAEILVHTGQHYDDNMSQVFFAELDIPPPDYNLGIGSGSHAVQTGAMLEKLEALLLDEKPDRVIVYGDTNSTLAGALTAAKMNIQLAHVEAGLRSFNRTMAEEINRIVADRLSDLLFCPSQTAMENLQCEGVSGSRHLVGDIMQDVLRDAEKKGAAKGHSQNLGLQPKRYLLATVHRAENADRRDRLQAILFGLSGIGETVVLPLHPRTRKMIVSFGLDHLLSGRMRVIEPQGYIEMVRLMSDARMILTDSGGMQKEAYWLGVPCVTLRDETEWVETVVTGWNVLAGAEAEKIIGAVKGFKKPASRPQLYGDGRSAEKIAELIGSTSTGGKI